MKTKKFRSPNGLEVYVSMTSGHTWRIGEEWKDVPEFGWSQCYSQGLISEDQVAFLMKDTVAQEALNVATTQVSRRDEVYKVVKGWLDNNILDNFNKSGKPVMTKISKELGYQVQRGVVDEVWHAIQQEMLNDDSTTIS